MQTWSDFEKDFKLDLEKKEKEKQECVTCASCGSQWFEQIEACRYLINHNLVIGQEIPERIGSVKYKFLRCLVCQNVIEPRVQHYTRDLATSDYDYLLDTLEGKFDKRKDKKEPNIFSEEL